MHVNPYANRAALRHADDFFGRTRELAEMYLLVAKNLCISLVGERRVGKTSLLFALASERKRLQFGMPPDRRFLFLNAQYLSDADEGDVVEHLLDLSSQDAGTRSRGSDRSMLRRAARELAARGERLVLM